MLRNCGNFINYDNFPGPLFFIIHDDEGNLKVAHECLFRQCNRKENSYFLNIRTKAIDVMREKKIAKVRFS